MKASELITVLQNLVDSRGDLDATVVLGSHEQSIVSADFAQSGPLRNLLNLQTQSPPARIVLEPKDNLE